MSLVNALLEAGAAIRAAHSVIDALKPAAKSQSVSNAAAFQTELRQALEARNREAVQRLLRARDADGNGTLSVEEFGGGREWFSKLDADRNGALDTSELMRMYGGATGASGVASVQAPAASGKVYLIP